MAKKTAVDKHKHKLEHAPLPLPSIDLEESQRPNGEAGDDFDIEEFTVEAEPASKPDELDNLQDYALEQGFNPNEVEHDPPVPCKRPPADVYFRVRPGAEHTLTIGLYEPTADDGERGDVYLVKKNMLHVFEGVLSQRQLFVCITVQGKIYLWPAKLPRPGRRSGGDRYSATALKGAELGQSQWVRVYADQDLKCYRIKHPADPFPDPDWSKVPSLQELMRRAFGDGRIIGSPDHPEAKRIIGLRNK